MARPDAAKIQIEIEAELADRVAALRTEDRKLRRWLDTVAEHFDGLGISGFHAARTAVHEYLEFRD